MKEIKFDKAISFDEKIEKNKGKVIDELLAKPFIRKKIEDLGITIEKFNEYLGYFVSYAEDYETCKYCKNLHNCNKEIKGMKMDIVLDEDGDLIREFSICKYKEEEYKIKQNYIIRDFGDEYLQANIESLDGRKGRIRLEKRICEIDLENSKEGIYVYGKSNSGKSYPLIALCNSFVRRDKKCAFINVRDFIESLKSTFNTFGDEYNNLMNKVKNSDVLVLDALGDEKISEWVRDDVLSTILDYRYKNKLLTFVTSLYSIEEIKQLYYDSGKNKSQSSKLKTEKFIEKIKANCPAEIYVGSTNK